MASREEMSTSFGSAAGAYESGRPDYPLEAVEWMLQPVRREDHPLRVADVGAGTGKLTRVLVEAGAEAVAIDPDPAMLAELRTQVHGIPTFIGTAERMPLPDASVDAVVLGQAWHWVDAAVGSEEAARVLRAGGVLGLIWNVRDETVEWVRRLTEIMHGSAAEALIAEGGPAPHPPFAAFERRSWGWTRTLTKAAFLDMMASRSYVITAEEHRRERILREVAELYDEIGGGGVLELPYRTEAFRGIRP
ncbi:class I SAM-dependent methyltransferase [Microbacterium sp. SS28]|uniref:class I SAM-dependent methyltransferase n=1 Tax=Microbacterium sp. SS28 TaxID=2919948 RepID=UPI001FAA818D|nr:class I SAM-dependent methyltransferase [Microbacterium sp. SS28]